MMTLLALCAYLLLGALEVRPLMRRRHLAEAAVTAAVTGAGAVYAAGLLGGWPVPNPVHIITLLFRPAAVFFGLL